MYESMAIIAFDQHAASVMAAVLLPGERTPALHPLSADLLTDGPICRSGPGRAVWSAVVTRPAQAGSSCSVFWRRAKSPVTSSRPALIPRRPGDRIKTDRRDASHLAVLYRAGTLTAVHVPTEQEEAARDLLRCREDIRADLLRARHRLSQFLLRHGRRFTGRPRRGLSATTPGCAPRPGRSRRSHQTHGAYLRTLDEAVARLRTVEGELRDLLTLEPLRTRVTRLRCFRGIDDLTALTIAAELGDPRRFPTAPSTMAFVGLVPSEHSSGAKRARGAITKTGNAHLRRVLVEAAWHYRHHPFVGAALRRRQEGAPAATIQRAWAAQQRLHHRYRRLAGRGKPRQHVVTAVARELTAFVWDVLTQ